MKNTDTNSDTKITSKKANGVERVFEDSGLDEKEVLVKESVDEFGNINEYKNVGE